MVTKSTIIPYFYIKTEKWMRVTTDVLSEKYSSVTSEGLSKTQVLSWHLFSKGEKECWAKGPLFMMPNWTLRSMGFSDSSHNKTEIETVFITKAAVYIVFAWFLCLKFNGVLRDFLVFIWNMHNFLVSRVKKIVPENKWARQFTEEEMERNGWITHLYLT